MEARLYRATVVAACFLSLGASYRTENFIVTANAPNLAKDVALEAETLRHDLAVEWLGEELPPWRDKCPIRVQAGDHIGAGGATSFMFEHGQPFGWTMSIQGSRERILDSVLPHEITHTVFATHFGRPLPRWADEGACTTVEHTVEKQKQHRMLYEFLTTGRGIAFNQMFAMKEYPPDVLPLYAQGYSLARYLIAQGGKQKFVQYVGDGMAENNWTSATNRHYGFKNLSELQVTWLDWVRKGSPRVQQPPTAIAQAEQPAADNMVAVAAKDEPAATPVTAVTADTSKGVPAKTAVASSRDGWYSRVRDDAFASSRAPNGGSAPTTRTASMQSTRDEESAGRSVSRPQPTQRPKQMILEWTRPNPSTPHATRGTPGNSEKSYLVSPEVLQGRMLR